MKKLYFSFVIALFSGVAVAQPILTSTHNPVIGDVFTTFNADTTGVTEGPSGANQTWNFSTLNVQTTPTTTTYMAPSATPYAASFTGSNLAADIGGTYAYFNTSSTDLRFKGIGNSTFVMAYSDDKINFTYTFTYTTTITDNIASTYTISSMTVNRTGVSATTGDAYGTLILPSGTYSNALRIHNSQNIIDDYGAYQATTMQETYTWFISGNKNFLLQINETVTSWSFGGPPTYVKSVMVGSPAVGVEEVAGNVSALRLFPNPTTENVTLSVSAATSQTASIEVMNVAGQVVATLTEELSAGENLVNIGVGGLPSGLYNIILRADNKVYSGRLVRQ